MRAQVRDGVDRGGVDQKGVRNVDALGGCEDAVVGHLHWDDFAGPADVLRRLAGVFGLRNAASEFSGEGALPQDLGVLPRLDLESDACLAKFAAANLLVRAIRDSYHFTSILINTI